MLRADPLHVATTEGIKGEDVCDLMVTAVEHRFGKVNRLPQTIEWLTDNGSCFIAGPIRRRGSRPAAYSQDRHRTPAAGPAMTGLRPDGRAAGSRV